MGSIKILYEFEEVVLNENNEIVNEYKGEVPHKKIILDTICKRSNHDSQELLLNHINNDLDQKILRLKAYPFRKGGETTMVVKTILQPGVRLSQRFIQEVQDWVSTQISDGLDEGIFGVVNIMHAPDGTRFFVEQVKKGTKKYEKNIQNPGILGSL